MAVYNKFNQFTRDVLDGKHNFSSDDFKVMLTNTAPIATNTIKSNLTEIAPASGYAAGGPSVSITMASVGGLTRVSGSNLVITSGGVIGPFQYVVFYNSTAALQPLVSWWDYGTAITLLNTETFTISFDAVNGILDIQ
jgi:hypothetical protein